MTKVTNFLNGIGLAGDFMSVLSPHHRPIIVGPFSLPTPHFPITPILPYHAPIYSPYTPIYSHTTPILPPIPHLFPPLSPPPSPTFTHKIPFRSQTLYPCCRSHGHHRLCVEYYVDQITMAGIRRLLCGVYVNVNVNVNVSPYLRTVKVVPCVSPSSVPLLLLTL